MRLTGLGWSRRRIEAVTVRGARADPQPTAGIRLRLDKALHIAQAIDHDSCWPSVGVHRAAGLMPALFYTASPHASRHFTHRLRNGGPVTFHCVQPHRQHLSGGVPIA